MTKSFVLIPGAGGMAWYWHRVSPLLQAAHCEAIAVDLPGDDESVSLNDYAEIVVRAIGERSDVVLVAQSLGGFVAPLVCARAPVRMLIFVNAMIPRPGETAGAWWENTGAVTARMAAAEAGGYSAEFDLPTYFLHDVPEAVLRNGPARQRPQAESVFRQRCGFQRWPAIPIRAIASANDRFFPVEFQKRVARDRLKMDPEKLPGGHLVALSNPQGLADLLLRLEHEAPDANEAASRLSDNL
jgi:pimeloyl-ACP methyl ester carboxylesterase